MCLFAGCVWFLQFVSFPPVLTRDLSRSWTRCEADPKRNSPPPNTRQIFTSAKQQHQSARASKKATPRRIQWSCGCSLGTISSITKFVLWPVVASTPRRSGVRYSGHSYAGNCRWLLTSHGCSSISGAGEYNTCSTTARHSGGQHVLLEAHSFPHAWCYKTHPSLDRAQHRDTHLWLRLCQLRGVRVPARPLHKHAADVRDAVCRRSVRLAAGRYTGVVKGDGVDRDVATPRIVLLHTCGVVARSSSQHSTGRAA